MSQLIQNLGKVGFPLLLLIFSVAYTITGISLGPMIVDGRLSPSFFPMVLGILAIGLSLVLSWRALQTPDPATDSESESESEPTSDPTSDPIKDPTPASEDATGVDRFRVILIIASTAVFILVFQRIGYVFSAPAYVLSIILLFSDRKNIIFKIMISIVTAIVAYLMFTQGFNVRLPELWG